MSKYQVKAWEDWEYFWDHQIRFEDTQEPYLSKIRNEFPILVKDKVMWLAYVPISSSSRVKVVECIKARDETARYPNKDEIQIRDIRNGGLPLNINFESIVDYIEAIN